MRIFYDGPLVGRVFDFDDPPEAPEPTVAQRVESRLDELGANFEASIVRTAAEIRTENQELVRRINSLEETTRAMSRGPEARPDEPPTPVCFGNLMRALVSGDWDEAPYEREVCQEGRRQQRDLGIGVPSAGGYIVPEEYLGNEFIELLYANMATQQAGVRRLGGLTGSPLRLGKLADSATAYWTPENTDITESEQTFDEVPAVPHALTAMVPVSNRLVMMGVPSVDGIIRADLAEVMGLALDDAILRGSGVGEEPLGLKGTTGVLTTSMDAVPTPASLNAILYAIENANADRGTLGWVMSPRSWNTIRQLTDASGTPYYRQDLGSTVPKALLGYPVFTTTQIPNNLGVGTDESEIWFGNWNDVLLPQWGGMEFAASDVAGDAFSKNQTKIRVIMLTDVAVRHPESICFDETVREAP